MSDTLEQIGWARTGAVGDRLGEKLTREVRLARAWQAPEDHEAARSLWFHSLQQRMKMG